MKKIVLASSNQGKIKEFNQIFAPLEIEIIPQAEFNVPECDEPFFTFIENALHKARFTSKYTDLPVLADDSGLCVNALNGSPGVFSARYAYPLNRSHNNEKLIKELSKYTNKSAYYYCCLVLIRNTNDPQPIIADGVLNGQIIDPPQGNNGFGYDPHMFLVNYNKTVAELDPELKNQISHRAEAIKNLLEKLV
ncbi:MAG: RdgB/HAM1 family non-canonical purine NTP pyrophosphatase [Proteobacteria bacterium]|jgi:XTP/dITP diphosphohydrolase|nr:RdgB/HAM1 family non-canonical purine NTP pyrophosphatase [Pseudomonadota bacterium]